MLGAHRGEVAPYLPPPRHAVVADSLYLDSDAVFDVRDSLIVDFDAHGPGEAPDGRLLDRPYWSAHYDFRLAPLAG